MYLLARKNQNILQVYIKRGETHHKNCLSRMDISKIKDLVSVAFQAGRMDAQFDVGLRPDKIRRKEAEYYLASKGYDKNILDKWVQNLLLKEYVGERRNSPKHYSLREINELLVSVQVKKII